MKRILLIAAVLLGVFQQGQAQENEYVPLVREGVKWVHSYVNDPYHPPLIESYFTLEMKGDTVIDGHCYKAVHMYSGEEINTENDTIPIFLREEDKVVYGIVPDGKIYPYCPIGIEFETAMIEKIESGQEFVLYDFNDFRGFLQNLEYFSTLPAYLYSLVIPDQVYVGDKLVNRQTVLNTTSLIEGIGYVDTGKAGLLFFIPPSFPSSQWARYRTYLSHIIENGEVIYQSQYNLAAAAPWPDYDYLPLLREGVQWVNQKVTINHGDTTYTYYTYEFNGKEVNRNYLRCFRYTGKSLDESDDVELAALFQGHEYNDLYRREYYIYQCPLFNQTIEEHRSMLIKTVPDGHFAIYGFSSSGYNLDVDYTPNFYIYISKGVYGYNYYDFPFTRDRLFEVEPLTIDGVSCSRFAYVDEQGNPLAYVVEGIGFDSYDMGDLLTPFTRKPDPDADHQEYWGLSHVVKDGKIIYKGMRYNAALVEGVKGDVNGDGEATIVDVTALIDYLLGATDRSINHVAADVNGNNEITISDVTALIDLLLTQ